MRMRFNKAEREAYTVGTKVEWRHGRYWYPGVIVTPIASSVSGSGFQSVGVRNEGPTTKTLSKGAYVAPHPTGVRLPAGA